MTAGVFAEHLLPSVLAIHTDTVPNTRIVLARLLTEHILKSCEFQYVCFVFILNWLSSRLRTSSIVTHCCVVIKKEIQH